MAAAPKRTSGRSAIPQPCLLLGRPGRHPHRRSIPAHYPYPPSRRACRPRQDRRPELRPGRGRISHGGARRPRLPRQRSRRPRPRPGPDQQGAWDGPAAGQPPRPG
ncbi:MAG: hypothetical protein MZU79_07325 [Anaerotruncus sp.]|nr:hypothetical protein [Anaerotruncus sp.]